MYNAQKWVFSACSCFRTYVFFFTMSFIFNFVKDERFHFNKCCLCVWPNLFLNIFDTSCWNILQCSRTCDKGRRRRTVTCEWLKGGSAPMSECGTEEKPLGVIDCYNPVCHQWPNFNDRLLGKFQVNIHFVKSIFKIKLQWNRYKLNFMFCHWNVN